MKTSFIFRKYLTIIGLLTGFWTLNSLAAPPHMLVGCWQSKTAARADLPLGNKLQIYQWFFSSDEFTSKLSLKDSSDAIQSYSMAYRIVEDKSVSPNPLIVFKSTCDEDFSLVVSIEELNKTTLNLHFETKLTTSNYTLKGKLQFERIAGPPENMD